MAVREFKSASKAEKFKKGKTYIVLLCAFLICFWVCFAVCASNNAEIEKYNSQIAEINEKTERVAAENEEYTNILTNGNSRDYFEKVAREVYGYCRPGEKVFYAPSN